MIIDPLISLTVFTSIVLASYGMGRPVVRALRVDDEGLLATVVWSMAIGLLMGGTLLSVLGILGVLYAPLIGALTLIACVGTLVSESRKSRRLRVEGYTPPDSPPWGSPPRWISRSIFLLASIACLGSLIGALTPTTAGDALCYHIELPKVFLAEHALCYLPDHDNSTFPLLTEMWYVWAIALDGPVAASLIHWGCGLLMAGASALLAEPIIGRRWAWLAGGLIVLIPGISNQMTAPLNDVAFAFWTTLALAAWWRVVLGDGARRWFLLAGLAGGGALGTKYLALVFALAVALTAMWTFLRRRRQQRLLLEAVAVVTVVAISVSGHWYVRAAWYRGNPFYPFLSEVIPSDGLPRHETLPKSKSPLGRNPTGVITATWHVTMQPDRFGGRGHQLGVLLLATLPGLVMVRRLRGLGLLLGTAACYWVFWYLLRQNVRFLFPVVPPLTVAAVWVGIEMRRFSATAQRVACFALISILLIYSAVAIRRCDDKMAVACGIESREDYLARNEPTWQAANLSNQLLGHHAHLLSQDYRAFYFQCRVTRENLFRQRTGYDRQFSPSNGLGHQLREAGFTHLLLVENLVNQGIQYDPTLSQLVDAADASEFTKLTEYWFHDTDGAVRRYRLMLLR